MLGYEISLALEIELEEITPTVSGDASLMAFTSPVGKSRMEISSPLSEELPIKTTEVGERRRMVEIEMYGVEMMVENLEVRSRRVN